MGVFLSSLGQLLIAIQSSYALPSLTYATDSSKRDHLSVDDLQILKSLYPQNGVALEVRPSSVTRRYSCPDLDPTMVGEVRRSLRRVSCKET